jgi:hypothetical protein
MLLIIIFCNNRLGFFKKYQDMSDEIFRSIYFQMEKAKVVLLEIIFNFIILSLLKRNV